MQQEELISAINRLRKEKNAVILAHYYQRGEVQDVADYVGDSLALAQWAATTDANIIVMCGVFFMAETAKILSPDKKVLIPCIEAGCSLADSCPADEFEQFVKAHPGHTVVSYVNTTASVKALTDIVVTSTNARKIIESLPTDERIVFGPDKNLGNYINSVTGRDMVLWQGGCHVHEQFSLDGIALLKAQYPSAQILAHPECKSPVLQAATFTGSTQALLNYAKQQSVAATFIVATESGIIHQMKRACPQHTFIPAPPTDSSCDGCNECRFMKMNTLQNLHTCLLKEQHEVMVDKDIATKAVRSINRMLSY